MRTENLSLNQHTFTNLSIEKSLFYNSNSSSFINKPCSLPFIKSKIIKRSKIKPVKLIKKDILTEPDLNFDVT